MLTLSTCVIVVDTAIARSRSIPRCDTFGASFMRPTVYVTAEPPSSTHVDPMTWPGLKNESAAELPVTCSATLSSNGCTANASAPPPAAQ